VSVRLYTKVQRTRYIRIMSVYPKTAEAERSTGHLDNLGVCRRKQSRGSAIRLTAVIGLGHARTNTTTTRCCSTSKSPQVINMASKKESL
jgi:hypothetical protein